VRISTSQASIIASNDDETGMDSKSHKVIALEALKEHEFTRAVTADLKMKYLRFRGKVKPSLETGN
jgi:hypothetical protein